MPQNSSQDKHEVKLAIYQQSSFLCMFMDWDTVKVHKSTKNELGPYPAILTEEAWSMKDLWYIEKEHYFLTGHSG